MPVWTNLKLGGEDLLARLSGWRSRRAETASLRQTGRTRPWNLWACLVLLALAAGLYALLVGRSLSIAYVDLGDGNYLYTAGRMADGLTIYRDFLSPQPPLHLLTGAALVRLGRWVEAGWPGGDIPGYLLVVRLFSLALHVLTMGWVFLLGRRLTQAWWGALLAAVLYLFLPLTFWWSLGYQSEPLEMFFLLGALVCFLPLRPAGLAAAGLLSGLAVLTNMTAAPYALACLLYLAVRHAFSGPAGRRATLAFALPLLAVVAAVAGGYELSTGGYLRNVIWNQVASYPPEGFWGYGFPKLLREASKVLGYEGGFLLLAALGLLLYNRSDTRPEREFLAWYALVLLLSIGFVTKGGTMDYIFTIGEPMVALFAAYFLVQFLHPATFRRFFRGPAGRDTSLLPQAALVLVAAFAVAYPPFLFLQATLRHEQFEQDVDGVQRMAWQIRKHSKEGEAILAPPYYAFLTRRLLVEEYSELYLWTTKYREERRAGQVGEGVLKVRAIEKELRGRRVPVVIANVDRPLLLFSPEVRSALEACYKPVLAPADMPRTLNFQMQVYVPKTDAELRAAAPSPPPAEKTGK